MAERVEPELRLAELLAALLLAADLGNGAPMETTLRVVLAAMPQDLWNVRARRPGDGRRE